MLAASGVTSSLLGTLPPEAADKVRRAVPVLIKGGVLRSVTPDCYSRLPLPANRRFQRAIGDVAAVVAELTARYRATGTPSAELLSVLALTADSAGQGFSDTQLRDQVITFYMAGVETSSAALAWIFYEIGRNPLAEQRVLAEVDSVLAGRPLDASDIDRFPYTSRVVTEVLRLYPVWFQMRRALRPVRFRDVELPAGTDLIYSPYLMHHDPRWFADPERFDPDRWLPGNGTAMHKRAFIPFAAGPHKCVGEHFAVLEYIVAIATICARWRLRPVPGRQLRPVPPDYPVAGPSQRRIRRRPILGSLINEYEWAAARAAAVPPDRDPGHPTGVAPAARHEEMDLPRRAGTATGHGRGAHAGGAAGTAEPALGVPTHPG